MHRFFHSKRFWQHGWQCDYVKNTTLTLLAINIGFIWEPWAADDDKNYCKIVCVGTWHDGMVFVILSSLLSSFISLQSLHFVVILNDTNRQNTEPTLHQTCYYQFSGWINFILSHHNIFNFCLSIDNDILDIINSWRHQ